MIGLYAGLGGVINGALCYFRIPAAVPSVINPGGQTPMGFSWSIIPGGFLHGAALALVPALFAARLRAESPVARWAVVPVAGWVSGWMSWAGMLLAMGVEGDGLGLITSGQIVTDVLCWPFQRNTFFGWWADPFMYFGLVGAAMYAAMLAVPPARWRKFRAAAAAGIAAGVLGSLWWWVSFRRPWFSLLHGAIWGALAGCGAWRASAGRPEHATP
jgi:hypothetical protein